MATAGDVNGDGYSDVIVGANWYDNGEADEGRAFVYHGAAAGPSDTAGWMVEGEQAYEFLGVTVSGAGDVNGDGYSDVIVGASGYDNGENTEGAAFVFHGSSNGVGSSADWVVESNQEYAWLGESLATAGDVNGDGYGDVIIGAHSYDSGEADEGAAFVYHGSATGLDLGGTRPIGNPGNADWTVESNQDGAFLSYAVASAGDVNGDGYADVIIGAPNYTHGEALEGAAFVFHGSASGLDLDGTRPVGNPSNADWMSEGDLPNTDWGCSVATAGDVNGDGYSDVILGAVSYNPSGSAFVFLGSPTGVCTAPAWFVEESEPWIEMGWSVATAGDVNGDGYSDVIIGAPLYADDESNEGAAFLWLGSADGLGSHGTPANADWMVESNQSPAWLGHSVASAGDVNGDGYDEVIVGAPQYRDGSMSGGAVFLWLGSADGLGPNGTPDSADWSADGGEHGVYFGWAVAPAGDVNGDGYNDLTVGARYYGINGAGAAFLHYGNGGLGLSLRPQQRRADDSAPIAPLGKSDSVDSFNVNVLGRTPYGRGGGCIGMGSRAAGHAARRAGYRGQRILRGHRCGRRRAHGARIRIDLRYTIPLARTTAL